MVSVHSCPSDVSPPMQAIAEEDHQALYKASAIHVDCKIGNRLSYHHRLCVLYTDPILLQHDGEM